MRGFRDLLVIGDQKRPDIFALNIRKSMPLYHRVVESPERLSANGGVLEELNFTEVKPAILDVRKAACTVAEKLGIFRQGGLGRLQADGSRRTLKSSDECEVMPSDRLLIKTPGGGGYGKRSGLNSA